MTSLLLLCLSVLPAQTSDLPPIDALEKKILDQKRDIKSGHFVMETKTWTTTAGKERVLKNVNIHEVWFDEAQESIRGDRRHSNPPGPDLNVDPVRRVAVHAKNITILATFQDRKDVRPTVSVMDSSHRNAKSLMGSVIHPRMIGMVPAPSGLFHAHDLQAVVGSLNRENVEIKKVKLAGIDCLRISFARPDKNQYQCRYWSRPDQDYTVQKIESEGYMLGPKIHWFISVENTFEKDSSSGIWPPNKSSFKQFENVTLIREEVSEIKSSEINKRIDPKIFTPEGLSMPPNTRVTYLKTP